MSITERTTWPPFVPLRDEAFATDQKTLAWYAQEDGAGSNEEERWRC